ncbi:MAG: hypothetical protein COA73_00420 [Candidatus Hydrogenedentota bacterium]|nr:MAG: hypothetical protein COA73_00420 [Candidatus Hydrogenedentota bacterium]
MALLKELASKAKAQRILELGPGTGNSAMSFLADYPCQLIGLDRSWGMLSQARLKGLNVAWVNGDACSQPFPSKEFDFVFSVLAFHHIMDYKACIQECFRVLKAGCLTIVTAPEKFIENHILNRYFPSFSSIDKARFQSESHLLDAMGEAGFQAATMEYCQRSAVPVDKEFAAKVEGKFLSTLALVPEDEFADGVARLNREIKEKGSLTESFIWEAVVISGWKIT